MLRIIVVVFSVTSLIVAVQYVKVMACIKKGNADIKPWQGIKPDAKFKVLFAGDSTAVGTGLEDNSLSTAGLFSRDFPDAGLENYSQNGLRLKGLVDILKTIQHKKFDLAVLQIGANDILFFTPMRQIRQDHERVIDMAKHIAKKILILHSGDIGEAPLFIWPFSSILTWRTLKVRGIYMGRQDARVSYLDIYTLNKDHDYTDCYARDHLHLNQKGYAIWYGLIKDQLKKLQWLPGWERQ